MHVRTDYYKELVDLEGNFKYTGEKIDQNHISFIIRLHGFHLAL